MTFCHRVKEVALRPQRGKDRWHGVSQILLSVRPGSDLLCSLFFLLQHLPLLGNPTLLMSQEHSHKRWILM